MWPYIGSHSLTRTSFFLFSFFKSIESTHLCLFVFLKKGKWSPMHHIRQQMCKLWTVQPWRKWDPAEFKLILMISYDFYSICNPEPPNSLEVLLKIFQAEGKLQTPCCPSCSPPPQVVPQVTWLGEFWRILQSVHSKPHFPLWQEQWNRENQVPFLMMKPQCQNW